ncbi:MAG: tetratricopeptide repeat protein [Alphaproteobacteria bacterium]
MKPLKLFRLLVGLGCLSPLSALSALAAATVQDIRIAAHPDHVRVVLDLDAPVTFTPRGEHAFTLHGLSGGSAVMNAQPKDAPLKRVVLTPDGDDTTLSFETSADVSVKAFPVSAGGNGGNRFVVDLYRALETPIAQALTTAPRSDLVATSAPPSQFVSRGPAVPAVAPRAPSESAPANASRPNAFSFVPPYNAPQAGPTPYEAADAQSSTTATAPAASSLPSASASAPPTNTVPFGQKPAQPESAESGGASPTAMEATVTSASAQTTMNAAPSDRTLLAERALDRGDAKAACTTANEALSASPKDLRALAVLGSCELALGDAVSARGAFSNALAIDPSYHRARIGLAETDVRQGDLSGARQEYSRVLADNPPTDETYKILDALQSLAAPGTMSAATPAPAPQSAAN